MTLACYTVTRCGVHKTQAQVPKESEGEWDARKQLINSNDNMTTLQAMI
jgi:hypothetical protein